jgi:hypothetical protein
LRIIKISLNKAKKFVKIPLKVRARELPKIPPNVKARKTAKLPKIKTKKNYVLKNKGVRPAVKDQGKINYNTAKNKGDKNINGTTSLKN